MISMKDLKFEYLLSSKMIKQAAKAYGEEGCKKVPIAREKEAWTQTMVTGTRIQIYVKLDSQVETDERFDAIIVSNLLVVIPLDKKIIFLNG